MGVDIVMFAERKDAGSWHPLPGKLNDEWREDEPGAGEPPEVVYDERNRELHDVLRGRHGNALLDGDFGAIRGLPDDLSPEVRREYDAFEEDAYDASWLLLSEVVAMPWSRRTFHPATGQETTFAALAGPEFMLDVIAYFVARNTDPSKVRFVYWFTP